MPRRFRKFPGFLERSFIAICTIALVSACSTPENPKDHAFNAMTQEMFRAMLSDIQGIYLEVEDLSDLTLYGLDALGDLDPAIAILETDTEIQLESNGVLVARTPVSAEDDVDSWSRNAALLTAAMREVSPQIQAETPDMLYQRMFSTIADRLDRYSRYAGPEDAQTNRESREGFGGIGVSIKEDPDGVIISTVEVDRPAAAAGLLVGDRIVAIDGKSIGGQSLRRIIRTLRGPINATVVLTILRDGLADPFDITVGRTKIVPNTVVYERQGKTAIIRISGFNERTGIRVAEAVARAKNDSTGPPDGLILDLRGNPGGLLERAVDVADLFLAEGLVSKTLGRHPRSLQRFEAQPGDIARGFRMAVLTNGASASAAEVLAAAMQDHGRAVVVGASTFGKGTVQTVLPLPNQGEFILTWARLLAPSGYALHDLGVMPTICVLDDVAPDILLRQILIDDPVTTLHNLSLRRRTGPNDDAGHKQVLATCPWEPSVNPQSVEDIAQYLVENPYLYTKAIEIGLPPAS